MNPVRNIEHKGGNEISNGVKVVVTGLGIVSAIGIGIDEFWKNLKAGRCGIKRVTSFDTKGHRTHKAAEVRGFDASKFIKNPDKKGRAAQFLLVSLSMAIKDSKLNLAGIPKDRIGVICGTTMAESQVMEEINRLRLFEGIDKVTPSMIIMGLAHKIPDSACFEYGLKGMSMMIPTACSAGNYAIGFGYDLLKDGRADIIFACASDAFSRVGFTGFNRLLNMAPDICQPFDKNRKGMIIGEGSAVLILEREKDARARQAHVYAEVAGYGLSCDAASITAPSLEGISRVMERALKNSDTAAQEVDYINAHGTGTVSNDIIECRAIKGVFGKRYKKIPVSAIKSMLGHTMGSASAIEAVSCCLTIRDSIIPPTINYKTPDPECDIDCVPNKSRSRKVDVVINNSCAFGGNNCCVVFKKYG